MTAAAHTDATTIDRIEVPAAMVPGLTAKVPRGNWRVRNFVAKYRECLQAIEAGQRRTALTLYGRVECELGRWAEARVFEYGTLGHAYRMAGALQQRVWTCITGRL